MSDKTENGEGKAWSGKTGGTRWMQQSLIGMFRYINPVLLYPLVWIWIVFYILFGAAGRRGIQKYWLLRDRVAGKADTLSNRIRRAGNLYRNYLEFGKVILDRFAAYSGRKIRVRIEGEEALNDILSRPEGFIVLGSHIGNQELAGYTFPMPKPMYVLVYVGDTETVNENRKKLFEKRGLHIIPVRKDGSHVLDMHNALSEGNILSVHADRLFFHSKAIQHPVLGEPADFPEGPFRVAVAEKVPVVSLFMMRERADAYTLYIRVLSDGQYSGKRPQQVQTLLQRYVDANEEMLARYPHQWFHFYEFWKTWSI